MPLPSSPDPSGTGALNPVGPVYLAKVDGHPPVAAPAQDGQEAAESASQPRDRFERDDRPKAAETDDPREPRRLADVMSHPVLTARSDQSVREVVALLAAHGIAGVPVVDEEGRLAGVISQSDIAAHVAHSWAEVGSGPDPAAFYQSLWITNPDLHEHMSAQTPVSQVMAPYVLHAAPEATLDEAADLMLTHNVHRVLVLRDQELAGIVTSLDLLRAYRQRS